MSLPEHLRALGAEVSNWGRWGDQDELGTLNLIDGVAVQRGIAAARTGDRIPLAIRLDANGPQLGTIPGRINPLHTMVAINTAYTGDSGDFCCSDDVLTLGLQAGTHWDALAHVSYEGRLYNGIDASVIDERGAGRLGIENFGPVVTRGLLADVARVHGLDHFDDGHAITGDDLDAAVDRAGVTVEPGDVLLVRTGQMHWLRQGDRERFANPSPGLSTRSVEWLRDHDVAAVATDTLVFEVWPPEDPAVLLPVHLLHLVDMGMPQGQLWALDDLAADCAADGQHDVLLCATPLPLTRSVGGAVAPTAVK
jgi:kynurenine formamidase